MGESDSLHRRNFSKSLTIHCGITELTFPTEPTSFVAGAYPIKDTGEGVRALISCSLATHLDISPTQPPTVC